MAGIMAACRDYGHVVVFDHQGEFAGRAGVSPALSVGHLGAGIMRGGLVVFDPIELFPGKVETGFTWFVNWLWSIAYKMERAGMEDTFLFCCDEIQTFCRPGALPQALKNIIECGRRYGLDMYCISNRPNQVHECLRTNLTDIYAFRLLDNNAKRFLDDAGVNYEGVERLNVGEYFHYDLNANTKTPGKVFKKSDAPKSKTVVKARSNSETIKKHKKYG